MENLKNLLHLRSSLPTTLINLSLEYIHIPCILILFITNKDSSSPENIHYNHSIYHLQFDYNCPDDLDDRNAKNLKYDDQLETETETETEAKCKNDWILHPEKYTSPNKPYDRNLSLIKFNINNKKFMNINMASETNTDDLSQHKDDRIKFDESCVLSNNFIRGNYFSWKIKPQNNGNIAGVSSSLNFEISFDDQYLNRNYLYSPNLFGPSNVIYHSDHETVHSRLIRERSFAFGGIDTDTNNIYMFAGFSLRDDNQNYKGEKFNTEDRTWTVMPTTSFVSRVSGNSKYISNWRGFIIFETVMESWSRRILEFFDLESKTVQVTDISEFMPNLQMVQSIDFVVFGNFLLFYTNRISQKQKYLEVCYIDTSNYRSFNDFTTNNKYNQNKEWLKIPLPESNMPKTGDYYRTHASQHNQDDSIDLEFFALQK